MLPLTLTLRNRLVDRVSDSYHTVRIDQRYFGSSPDDGRAKWLDRYREPRIQLDEPFLMALSSLLMRPVSVLNQQSQRTETFRCFEVQLAQTETVWFQFHAFSGTDHSNANHYSPMIHERAITVAQQLSSPAPVVPPSSQPVEPAPPAPQPAPRVSEPPSLPRRQPQLPHPSLPLPTPSTQAAAWNRKPQTEERDETDRTQRASAGNKTKERRQKRGVEVARDQTSKRRV